MIVKHRTDPKYGVCVPLFSGDQKKSLENDDEGFLFLLLGHCVLYICHAVEILPFNLCCLPCHASKERKKF